MGDALPTVNLGTNRTAKAIAAGQSKTCAILDDDTVKCWGSNSGGSCGQGTNVPRYGDGPGEMGDALPPIRLGNRKAVAVAPGAFHVCVLLDNRTIKCFGANQFGELGYGDTALRGGTPQSMGSSLPPVDLGTFKRAKAVSAGTQYTCALLLSGNVACWGENSSGRLGIGDIQGAKANIGDEPFEMGDNLQHVRLGIGQRATAVSSGDSHACVLLENGKVSCFGWNVVGQCGVGSTENIGDQQSDLGSHLESVDLGTDAIAVAIDAGFVHTCAILSTGAVKCWGSGEYGCLGIGETTNRGVLPGQLGNSLPTVNLGAGRTAVAIGAGFKYSCALLDNGDVICWGLGSNGQLGQGNTDTIGDSAGEMATLLPINLGH